MEDKVKYIAIDGFDRHDFEADRFGDEAPVDMARKWRDEQHPGAKLYVEVYENND